MTVSLAALKETVKTEKDFFAYNGEKIHYEVARSKRRKKTIALSLNEDGMLRLSVPYKTPAAAIQKILQERGSWVALRLQQARQKKAETPPHTFTQGDHVTYRGFKCRLSLKHDDARAGTCFLLKNEIVVYLPKTHMSAKDQAAEVRTTLLLWFKKRARLMLQKRMERWSQHTGLTPKQILVTSPDKRWGSCSVDNIIRLNWQLVMASVPLMDYVILHELCHITHKNHGKRFWSLVERFMPDYRERRQTLRKNAAAFKL